MADIWLYRLTWRDGMVLHIRAYGADDAVSLGAVLRGWRRLPLADVERLGLVREPREPRAKRGNGAETLTWLTARKGGYMVLRCTYGRFVCYLRDVHRGVDALIEHLSF